MSFSSSLFCDSDVRQDSAVVRDGWVGELHGRVLVHEGAVEDYLDTFVPCSRSHPYATAPGLSLPQSPFAEYHPAKGQEVRGYRGLRLGLIELVKDFQQTHRPSFVVTKSADYPFPFAAFAKNHHRSSPDISISFPGECPTYQSLLRDQWYGIGGVIEVKPTKREDPFPGKNGVTHQNTVIQLTRNTRNLMHVHGLLSAYALGIYGETGRIARADRSCVVVSQPFNIKERPDLVQRFFWHWTHPSVGTTIVGCDPTVRRLTPSEKTWLSAQLAHKQPSERSSIDPRHYRRFEVYDERDGSMTPYFAYEMVDVNARLLSRSTTVWRVLEDRTVQDPNAREPVKTRILKDAWRQLVRKSEATFYERLSGTIAEEDYFGIARLVCGGDLGQMEVRQWGASSTNADILDGQRELRLSESDDTADETAADDDSDPEEVNGDDDIVHPPAPPAPTVTTYPLPYPQHQTFSWAIIMGQSHTHLERSHMRFVVDDVGRTLTDFKNTKELVRAVRDAIRGHRVAWEQAGVLHRDISLGNILITDDPTEGGCHGFIHDFDYSSMTELPPGQVKESTSKVVHDPRKERTGTHYFIAHEIMAFTGKPVIHRPHHDLESVYWVLLWVVLRHTEHNLGQQFCTHVFSLTNGPQLKIAWLMLQEGETGCPFIIERNEPLTQLMEQLRNVVSQHVLTSRIPGFKGPPILTYDAVLQIFDAALAKDDWPAEDHLPCTLLDPVKASTVGSMFVAGNGFATAGAGPQAGPSRRETPGNVPDAGRHAISGPVPLPSLKRGSASLGEGSIPPRNQPEAAQLGSSHRDAPTDGPVAQSGKSKRRKVEPATRSAASAMGSPALPTHTYAGTRHSKRSAGSSGASAKSGLTTPDS
ncbi:hypothetical protein C8Q76DRAFT_682878 [Earliella scabrosa]|nr:hypothetical protein C8Q76DRAFT_682878 [Earliella scabrosa]